MRRYADSNGLDENFAHAHAWRYRLLRTVSTTPSTVSSSSRLQEIFAEGSLEGSEPIEDRNGFLAFGPKLLAEPDPVEMDMIDEQLDAVVGLSLVDRRFAVAITRATHLNE